MKIDLKNKVNFENAIRAMRMPYESFDKNDSDNKKIGDNDLALALKLIKGGSEHRKFLRFIQVDFETIAPLYWYTEMATYKYATRSSSSTMHLLEKQRLSLSDFSFYESKLEYKDYEVIQNYIDMINNLIESKKADIQTLKGLLPDGYMMMSAFSANYETLIHIYKQRLNHRLPEWKEFCEWIESLPYMKQFIEVLK